MNVPRSNTSPPILRPNQPIGDRSRSRERFPDALFFHLSQCSGFSAAFLSFPRAHRGHSAPPPASGRLATSSFGPAAAREKWLWKGDGCRMHEPDVEAGEATAEGTASPPACLKPTRVHITMTSPRSEHHLPQRDVTPCPTTVSLT